MVFDHSFASTYNLPRGRSGLTSAVIIRVISTMNLQEGPGTQEVWILHVGPLGLRCSPLYSQSINRDYIVPLGLGAWGLGLRASGSSAARVPCMSATDKTGRLKQQPSAGARGTAFSIKAIALPTLPKA